MLLNNLDTVDSHVYSKFKNQSKVPSINLRDSLQVPNSFSKPINRGSLTSRGTQDVGSTFRTNFRNSTNQISNSGQTQNSSIIDRIFNPSKIAASTGQNILINSQLPQSNLYGSQSNTRAPSSFMQNNNNQFPQKINYSQSQSEINPEQYWNIPDTSTILDQSLTNQNFMKNMPHNMNQSTKKFDPGTVKQSRLDAEFIIKNYKSSSQLANQINYTLSGVDPAMAQHS